MKKILKLIFNKYIWTLVTLFFTIAFVIFVVGESVVRENEGNINYALGINPYDTVMGGEEDEEVINDFPSEFLKDDGSFDDVAMRANSMAVSKVAASEGAVLLWNKNDALPLKANSKISLFGVSTKPATYLYTGHGSGRVSVTASDFPDLKAQFESEGKFTVNPTLWNSYPNATAWQVLSNPNGDDNHYREFTVNEKSWRDVNNAAGSSFAQYGDAAIYIISRTGAEDGDTWFDTSKNTNDNHLDNNYLDLTANEKATLTALQQLKGSTFNSLILVLNTGTPMQMKNISQFDIDACLWAGMGGNASFAALYNVMSGKVNPSGRLVDTYAYDGNSAPSSVNTGAFEFSEYGSLPDENRGTNTYNHAYIVYEEGIYVGYRYYETRYADCVAGEGKANGTAGVVNGKGTWSYKDEVKFPFGYGLSYTEFSYSGFKVEKKGDNYNVSVTVTNDGSVAGKTPVQIYLQKPYTGYDKQTGIEKSAIELVGYTKTDLLQPKESKTYTVTVKGSEFKTYDSYGKKTYILEAGDYYLSFGTDAHDALNNILARKGYTKANGMVNSLGEAADGNANFSQLIQIKSNDFEKYAYSAVNSNYKITNQFDDADITLYAGTADQKNIVKYLSRFDWQGTYPDSPVVMKARNRVFVKDMQYSKGIEVNPDAVLPTYGTVTSPYGKLSLAMLKGVDYDSPYWDDLLNQLTWDETVTLAGVGNHIISACPSVSSPAVIAYDGPAGLREKTPKDVKTSMAFPSGVLLASCWNDKVVEDVCKAFGHELIHAGVGEIYGTGAGMHRSVYGGRNWEYFSEDPYISGQTLLAEVKGLQSKGAIVNIKHFALNDQEIYRCGGTTWANEQSIREIYLKAFEAAVVEGHANGVMSSLNRIGCTWAGKSKGLLTEVLRNEWGFVGLVETDAASGRYMSTIDARAEAVIAGNDLWLRGSTNELWQGYEKNATVAQALRESAHRILYTVLNSFVMDGMTTSTTTVYVTPWYYALLTKLQIAMGVLMGVSFMMTVASFVLPLLINKKRRNDNEEK
ncbi:MAG: glycoside hydrolase family 3 C-terminal domain-containing protein [Clostridiales bacterium]|nr:glycoside hydrolase family 3 C-terminal domain-containing protein [Clostridiales bacterium]